MPKAYWIAHVTVTDPEPYAIYAAGATAAFGKYNGKVLARGGEFRQMEGDGHPRNVVVEFPSMQAALECYNSPEYQEAKTHRKGAGIANIVFVEGAD